MFEARGAHDESRVHRNNRAASAFFLLSRNRLTACAWSAAPSGATSAAAACGLPARGPAFSATDTRTDPTILSVTKVGGLEFGYTVPYTTPLVRILATVMYS